MFLGKTLLPAAALLAAGLSANTLLSHEPRPAKAYTGVDRLGDPLPSGAVARLGTVRFRYDDYGTTGLAFLSDGKTVVTASGNGWLRFWEASSGKLLREFRSDKLELRGFALSADGKHIAVGGFVVAPDNAIWPGMVRVLDASTGKEVRSFARPERGNDHCSLAFTRDGKFLASLSGDGALRIEEIATGTEILQQKFPRGGSGQLALSPDGSILAVAMGGNSQMLYLWRWQEGEEPRPLKIPARGGSVLSFSPDGKRLAECGFPSSSVRIWDVKSGRLVDALSMSTSPDYSILNIAYSPNGEILAGTAYSRHKHAVYLWDAKSGRLRGQLDLGGDAAGRLAFSPDSRRLALSGDDLRIWDLDSRKEMAAYEEAHHGRIESVVAAAGGVVATASDDHTVRVWDIESGRQKVRLEHDNWVRGAALSPDGSHLVSSSLDDTVRLWDLHNGRQVYRLPGHGEVGGKRVVGFTPDGKRFLSWGDDSYLRVWDAATGKAILEHRIRPSGIKIPDEDDDSAANMREGRMLLSFAGSACSGDGKRFILAIGATVHLFDVESGKEIRIIKTEQRNLDHLAVSPDGKRLLASGWGKAIQTRLSDGRMRLSTAEEHPLELYDLDTGKCLHRLTLPGQISGPVAFSADGKTFAAAVEKPTGTIRFWDTTTAAQRASISGFRGKVRAMAFTPDGRRMISAMENTTALVWDLTALPQLGQEPHPAKAPAGVDRLGDPLPAGAAMRLGTVRVRYDGYGTAGLAFLPDGKTFVTAGGNSRIRFWETSSGKRFRELNTDKNSLKSFALSRDGKHIAVGGIVIAEGAAHGRVRALTFTPDGRRLIAAMEDTTALVWDLNKTEPRP